MALNMEDGRIGLVDVTVELMGTVIQAAVLGCKAFVFLIDGSWAWIPTIRNFRQSCLDRITNVLHP